MLLSIGIILFSSLRSQDLKVDFDSIPIKRLPLTEQMISVDYLIEHQMFRKVSLVFQNHFQEKHVADSEIFGDLMDNTLTAIFGESLLGEKPMKFYLYAKIETDDIYQCWDLDLFINGYREKVSRKNKVRKGGVADPAADMVWGKGAWAVLRKGSDTISRLVIIRDPIADTVMTRAREEIMSRFDEKLDKSIKFDPLLLNAVDQIVFGVFRGSPMKMIYFNKSQRLYILLNDSLDAVFYVDKENYFQNRRKGNFQPKLWVRKELDENRRTDIILLALTSKMLTLFIRPDNRLPLDYK
jgi:hypothetical protein